MTVGDRIKAARTAAKISQKELGSRCGIADSTIRSYEAGRLNPKLSTLTKISEGLGIPVDALADFSKVEARTYTIWKNNWPIGEISLYQWQASQANDRNKDVHFAIKKEEDEE